MGTYTELVLGVTLRTDTPQAVIGMLQALVAGNAHTLALDAPEYAHRLFATERWMHVCNNETAGFPRGQSVLEHDEYIGRETDWSLSVRSSMKNYEQEYEAFLDWLFPYVVVDKDWAEFCGYMVEKREDSVHFIYLTRRNFCFLRSNRAIPFDDFAHAYPLDEAKT